MAQTTPGAAPALTAYLKCITPPEPEILAQQPRETAALPGAAMQITPEQAQFLERSAGLGLPTLFGLG